MEEEEKQQKILKILKNHHNSFLSRRSIQSDTHIYWEKINKIIDKLVEEGKIIEIKTSNGIFYKAKKRDKNELE